MKIKNIQVDGYRIFKKETVLLEEDTSVIAGANNSGKTSFIDLLSTVFGKTHGFSSEDLNAAERFVWAKSLLGALQDECEESVQIFLNKDQTSTPPPTIEVRFEVGYSPGQDDIREFADYLMDLELEKHAFYFCYRLEPNWRLLREKIETLQPELEETMSKFSWPATLTDKEFDTSTFRAIQNKLDRTLLECSQTNAYFCDENYNIRELMEKTQFQNLFNFKAVKAARQLDDVAEDKSRRLSAKLVEVAKTSKDWTDATKNLPQEIQEAIDNTDVHKITKESALTSLNEVIESISKTSGNSTSDLFLDFLVADEDIVKLISNAIQTQYRDDGAALSESSQGLGYSNLIYLHLETEAFAKNANTEEGQLRVNLLAIEEPESHMHPQMQNAFIKHLFEKVKGTTSLQAIVTTHSSEMIRSSTIHSLRVLKVLEGICQFIDLKEFHEKKVMSLCTEKRRLFDFLYQINFADVLFADKVVMYEGDTERMYIQALIEKDPDFDSLRTQYVSYVQVGGAYAHVYKPLIIDALKIKTVILTDIDYDKNADIHNGNDLTDLNTTNETLNKLFQQVEDAETKNPTIGKLYNSLEKHSDGIAHVENEPLLAVAFQTGAEGFARTFEEAILSKRLNLKVWEKKSKRYWKDQQNSSQLKFSIPQGDENADIRDIVVSSSNNKTDFAYSLLLSQDFPSHTPDYISNALKWLSK